MKRLLQICCGVIFLTLPLATSWGAGAMLVSDKGPFTWPDGKISWHAEGGNLGPLSNAQVLGIINEAFATWSSVGIQGGGSNVTPVSLISAQLAATLPTDITAKNFSNKESQYKDKGILFVFDETGNIMKSANMDPGTYAAYSRITSTDGQTNTIKGAIVVLSASYLGGSTSNLSTFKSIVTHEVGHALNLDHTAINYELFDLTTNSLIGNPAGAALMFPIVASQKTHLDDAMGLALVNPVKKVTEDLCVIQGHIVGKDEKGFPGALVRAHNTSNAAVIAGSMVSGALSPPGTSDGYYKFYLPPGSYHLFIDSVPPMFAGGSSVGQVDPPTTVPPSTITSGGSETVSCAAGGQTVAMDTIQLGQVTSELNVSPIDEPAATGGGGCAIVKY